MRKKDTLIRWLIHHRLNTKTKDNNFKVWLLALVIIINQWMTDIITLLIEGIVHNHNKIRKKTIINNIKFLKTKENILK